MEAMPDPGWYSDPDDEARVRWWDGDRWSDHSLLLAEVLGHRDDAAPPAPEHPPSRWGEPPPQPVVPPPSVPSSPEPRRRSGRLIAGVAVVAAGLAAGGAWLALRPTQMSIDEVRASLDEHGQACRGAEVPVGAPESLMWFIDRNRSTAPDASLLRRRVTELEAGRRLSVQWCTPSGWILRSGDDVVAVAVPGSVRREVAEQVGDGVAVVTDASLIPTQPDGVADDPPQPPPSSSVVTTQPMGPAGGPIDNARRVGCEVASETVKAAVDQYRALEGSWPAAMADLVPEWLGEDPRQIAITFAPNGDAPPTLQWLAECAGLPGP